MGTSELVLGGVVVTICVGMMLHLLRSSYAIKRAIQIRHDIRVKTMNETCTVRYWHDLFGASFDQMYNRIYFGINPYGVFSVGFLDHLHHIGVIDGNEYSEARIEALHREDEVRRGAKEKLRELEQELELDGTSSGTNNPHTHI